MIMNYESHGFKVTAKELPKSCTDCPFWVADDLIEFGLYFITGHVIRVDEKNANERMDDCPVTDDKSMI